MAIARHSMSGNVAHYIQSHGAIQQWVDVLRKKHIKPLESVERIVSLFCFLQDSSSCTQQLLDAFETADGYVFLAELLLSDEVRVSGIIFEQFYADEIWRSDRCFSQKTPYY